jgi:hypothetical protein
MHYHATLAFGATLPPFLPSTVDVKAGDLNIDEAFVTPLVVTQAINLTLETFIPSLLGYLAHATHQKLRDVRRNLRESRMRCAGFLYAACKSFS